PRPAFLPRHRLPCPLRLFAVPRQRAAAGRRRRYRLRRPASCRCRGYPAGDQRRALCDRYRPARGLCRQRETGRHRGADRQQGGADRPPCAHQPAGADRHALLLPCNDPGLCGCRDADSAAGGARRDQGSGGHPQFGSPARRVFHLLHAPQPPQEDFMSSRILHRTISHAYPVAVGGAGVYVEDAQGKRYIDASGGAAVSCLGHGHPDVTRAMHEQADRLAFAHTSFFTTEPAERLADHLVSRAPAGISHAYYVSGGSEAIEAALKMARQYFVEKGEPQRRHFIARRQSYHGNTLGALSIGGNAWRRQQFAPLLIEAHHIAPCFEYRDRRPDETPEVYGRRVADELEAKILELG